MTRIHQLHLGHVRLPDSHPRASERTCQIYSYAIEHPDGVIVIDTGPRAGHPIIDDLYAPDVISIIDALNTVGIDERDIAAVFNTHLHFDHCGQNHLLDHAPVWITEAELDVSTSEFYTVPEWATIEPDRLRLAADGETIADGITILHTPGHTPGHLSITAHTDIGLEIVVGQACYTCAEYDASTIALTDMHTADWHSAGLDSLARLRALQPDRAHFSHDATTHTPS
ncbi:MAG: MBL fold metallo-hydrolase [Acidimicrobiales bacterium]|nr:MBL fold metallo-hydrolase [Acidimicrobiales bacterium]